MSDQVIGTECAKCLNSCEQCETCNNCDQCQGCDQCDSCNTCQSCEGNCDESCITPQTYWALGQQQIGINFSWNCPVAKDQTIAISAENFNSLLNEILRAYNTYDGKHTINGSSLPYVQGASSGNPSLIRASAISTVADYLWGLGGNSCTNSKPSPNRGDVIYASIFNDLKTAVNTLKYAEDQCPSCNNGCQTCQSCQHCNICQSHNKCDSCNLCEGCNRCDNCNTCQGSDMRDVHGTCPDPSSE